jgi:hypothetical protein
MYVAKMMEEIIIHPNKFYVSSAKPKKKHFIFDLDETLGSFSDMYCLWKGLHHLFKKNSETVMFDKTLFCEIINLYPEFLRYGIATILQYLHHKKTKKQCGNVYLYTNNQCESPWVECIVYFFETQFNIKNLFERPICAFKINNKPFDNRRTSHEKSYGDFLKCSLLPKNAELCFIDDTFFPKMQNDQIFYLQLKPYQHSISVNEIIHRFIASHINKTLFLLRFDEIYQWFQSCGGLERPEKDLCEKKIDIEISRRLMYTIREFFYLSIKKEKTKRNRSHKLLGKFTRKKRFCQTI